MPSVGSLERCGYKYKNRFPQCPQFITEQTCVSINWWCQWGSTVILVWCNILYHMHTPQIWPTCTKVAPHLIHFSLSVDLAMWYTYIIRTDKLHLSSYFISIIYPLHNSNRLFIIRRQLLYLQYMVFTVIVYFRKYIYIIQLQITHTLLSSIYFRISYSRSHKQKSFHETVNGIRERIC